MAPEIFQGKGISEKVDIWAAGIIVYFMVFGKHPFNGRNLKTIGEQVKT